MGLWSPLGLSGADRVHSGPVRGHQNRPPMPAALARSTYGRRFKIETQNVNVPAWRFYQKMGCTLGCHRPVRLPGQPAEAQLLRWKALAPPDTISS